MYDREKKNINKLLESIQVTGIHAWYVSDLRDMEWNGQIRLTLNVVIHAEYLRNKYINGRFIDYNTSDYEYNVKQKLIGLLKHYVRSFLDLYIGDVKVVNLISYEMVNPTNYHTTYSDHNNLYTTYDEYDWFA